MISRLGIVIKNERRQVNVKILQFRMGIQGWHKNQERQDRDALYIDIRHVIPSPRESSLILSHQTTIKLHNHHKGISCM